MIPQGVKIDFEYKPSKGYDTANEVYHKYGKDYSIKDYINEFNEGTIAKNIIKQAGGLNMLPGAMQHIKDSEIVIDMNEDLFTINRKLKLGQIAQRKFDELKAQETALKTQETALKTQQEQQTKTQGGNE